MAKELKNINDPLVHAIWNGKPFKNLFRPDCSWTSHGLLPGHLAALKKDLIALQVLKDLNYDFSLPNAKGFLPCHFAAFYKSQELQEFFCHFALVPVRGTTHLTPQEIQLLISQEQSLPLTQNIWTPDALYYAFVPNSCSFLNLDVEGLLQLQKHPVIGWDVIAVQSIEANRLISTYDGEVSLGSWKFSLYAHSRFFRCAQGDLVIDGLKYGSLGCLFNDSAPNVSKEVVIDSKNGLPRIVFRTLRIIEKGESISWDYGPTHLVKKRTHIELQTTFLSSHFNLLLHRTSQEAFCRAVLSKEYQSNIAARLEVETALYLDNTLHTLVWATASGLLQEFHIRWMSAIVHRHKKTAPSSSFSVVLNWLQKSSKEEKQLLLQKLSRCHRHELLFLLQGQSRVIQWKAKGYRLFLDTIHYLAHSRSRRTAQAWHGIH